MSDSTLSMRRGGGAVGLGAIIGAASISVIAVCSTHGVAQQ
ncbi:hypothetical protein [Corynebacterium durum]|nr:hypothetical protein [Corynebacterium durum]MDO4651840.1 hypothetical protein [Corynebacterium durum]